MRLRKLLDEAYEAGHCQALAGVPLNTGAATGKDERYRCMAFRAGYHAAEDYVAQIAQLSEAMRRTQPREEH